MPVIHFSVISALLIIFSVVLSAFFYKKQNRSPIHGIGGKVSLPKSFWLSYTLVNWFLLPFAFIFSGEVSFAYQVIFTVHLLSWWVRAPIEYFMLYRFHNWSPRHGIRHDQFHLLLLLFLITFFQEELLEPIEVFDFIAFSQVIVIIIATLFETFFAFSFLKQRGAQPESTTIYFASDDPKYRTNNNITLCLLIFLYAHWVIITFMSC